MVINYQKYHNAIYIIKYFHKFIDSMFDKIFMM